MELKKHIFSYILVLSLLIAGITLSLMTPSTYIVFGANFSNVTSQVNITNTEPWVTNVVVDDLIDSPADEIDLSPGSTILVRCNATANDYNGWDDINGTNATLYQNSKSATDTQANSTIYYNSNCQNISIDAESIDYSCNFTVTYYAWNGTWTCNVTTRDSMSLVRSNSTTTYMNELFAINIPGVIDYGNMEVHTNSSVEVQKNVTNYGNTELDLDLYGFARTIDDGLAMNCTRGGGIPVANEYFDINESNNTIDQKTSLSGVQAAPNQVNFELFLRNDSNGYNYTKLTDWKLEVPYSVAGWCNGTVVFSGVPDIYS